jgi:hypothetical protein
MVISGIDNFFGCHALHGFVECPLPGSAQEKNVGLEPCREQANELTKMRRRPLLGFKLGPRSGIQADGRTFFLSPAALKKFLRLSPIILRQRENIRLLLILDLGHLINNFLVGFRVLEKLEIIVHSQSIGVIGGGVEYGKVSVFIQAETELLRAVDFRRKSCGPGVLVQANKDIEFFNKERKPVFRCERDDPVYMGIIFKKVDALLIHNPENGAPGIFSFQPGEKRSRPENVSHGRSFDDEDLLPKRPVMRAMITEQAEGTRCFSFKMKTIAPEHGESCIKNKPYLCHKPRIKANAS